MKKVLCLILALVFSLSLTACGPEIEDTNGADDFSLNTITEQNIIDMDLGSSAYSTSPADEDLDLSEMTKFKAKNFSGVAEIYTANFILKSDVTFDMGTIQVDQGNFRLMVLIDDEIVHDFDLEEMGQSFELRDIKGTVSVRMAGESAAFKFFIEAW